MLFTLATIIGIFAVLAVWANRQALNTDNWTNTSSQLLANKKIQTAVAAYAVNELFSSGLPAGRDQVSAADQAFQPLAGPVTSGLQQLAGQVAPKLLASSQVQARGGRPTVPPTSVLMKIINGGGSLAVDQWRRGHAQPARHHHSSSRAALGVQQQVAAALAKLQANAGTVQGRRLSKLGITLPPSSGQLVIMRSNPAEDRPGHRRRIKSLALVLPLLAFACSCSPLVVSRGAGSRP